LHDKENIARGNDVVINSKSRTVKQNSLIDSELSFDKSKDHLPLTTKNGKKTPLERKIMTEHSWSRFKSILRKEPIITPKYLRKVESKIKKLVNYDKQNEMAKRKLQVNSNQHITEFSVLDVADTFLNSSIIHHFYNERPPQRRSKCTSNLYFLIE